MAEKTFINTSSASIQVTVFVRQDDIPYLNSDTVTFELSPGETKTINYDDLNPSFFNGIAFSTINDNDLYSKVQYITALESELDNLLNANSLLTFTEVETDYVLTGSNPENPALDAVNVAQTFDETKAAIENTNLGLNLSAYHSLTDDQQIEVTTYVLNNRPIDGYPTVQDVQNSILYIITTDWSYSTIYK